MTNEQIILLLERLETEMRYAGWKEENSENVGQQVAYGAVVDAIAKLTQTEGIA